MAEEYILRKNALLCLELQYLGETDHIAEGVLRTARTKIFRLPYIEAEPVRHGRWIEGGLFNDLAKCSVCGAKNFTFGFVCENKFGYCPNCGARMDGGTE